MEAGSIEPLNGIYKNAFNLIIGAQGRGKTYHANDLISKNTRYFEEVKKFAPGGSCGEFDGDVNDLIRYLEDRVRKSSSMKEDIKAVKALQTAITTGDVRIAQEAGLTKSKLDFLMEAYPTMSDVGRIKPALVLIDDMGGDPVIKKSETIFNDIARRLRHLQVTIIFNAHQYKDLAPFVRSNTQMLYLHGGLPIRDLKLICQERRVPNIGNYRDLEARYEGMTNANFFGWFPVDFYGKQQYNLNPPKARPGEGEVQSKRDKPLEHKKVTTDINDNPLIGKVKI